MESAIDEEVINEQDPSEEKGNKHMSHKKNKMTQMCKLNKREQVWRVGWGR